MANFPQTAVPFGEPTNFDAPPVFVSAVHTVQVGVIVGAVIGALAFIACIVAAIVVWRRKTGRGRGRGRDVSKTSSDATYDNVTTIPPGKYRSAFWLLFNTSTILSDK